MPLHIYHVNDSAILASLHVCVPSGFSLNDWEKTERSLQHCFSEYGVSHVTISPEIGKEQALDAEGLIVGPSSENTPMSTCSSRDHFGCAVDGMKKRKPNQVWFERIFFR